MILDAIVTVLLGIFEGVFGLIPAYDLPNLGSWFSQIGNAVATANSIFPVVTLGAVLALVFGFKLLLVAFDLVVFVYDRIPLKMT